MFFDVTSIAHIILQHLWKDVVVCVCVCACTRTLKEMLGGVLGWGVGFVKEKEKKRERFGIILYKKI